jgi:hypothetical protein
MVLISFASQGFSAPPTVDPSVFEVRSSGWWKEADHGGTYRVVVRHGGFEHINTSVQLEWLMQANAATNQHVVHSALLLDTLLGSVTIKSMERTEDGVKLVLGGPMDQGPDYYCEVALQPGGKYTKVAGC